MARLFKKSIPYLITIILIAIIIYLLGDQRKELSKIIMLSTNTILYVVGIFVIFQFGQAIILKLMLKSADQFLSIKEAFYLVSLRSFLNYLPLNAGMVSVGMYMKKSENFPLSQYLGLMVGVVILSFLSHGIVGLLVLLYHWIEFGSANLLLFLIVLGLICAPVILIYIPLPGIKKSGRVHNWIILFKDGWHLLRSHKSIIVSILLLQMTMVVLMSIQFLLIAVDLHFKVGFVAIIFINIFGNLLRVNTIFPGNLGLREAVAGTVASSLSLNFMDGFLPTAISHLISLVCIVIIGIPVSLRMTHSLLKQSDQQHSSATSISSISGQ